ncbi:hypothetical protein SCOCK_130110 [Actinacidiphila cocklensis]|uniref:Uncharacterized protein n=1 Tax=Actinacidiphila cocklensis TaxID=887465 RepID=A0A9W4GQM3_9ACTN|nr:hypothetical protein SCOCK_130110 [Actinacidiphila cocklensis]
MAGADRRALAALRRRRVRLRGAAQGPGAGLPRAAAVRRGGGGLVRPAHGPLRGRLGALPRHRARARRAGRRLPARGAVQLRLRPPGPQAAHARRQGPLRGAAVRRRAGRLQARGRGLPRRLPRAGPGAAGGRLRRQRAGHRRPRRGGGGPAGHLAGPARGRRTAGTGADHRTARAARAAALRYPFWSGVPDRVMFFLRRPRGPKGPAGSVAEQDPQGLRFGGVWCNWQHG